jgi:hypothetical protein
MPGFTPQAGQEPVKPTATFQRKWSGYPINANRETKEERQAKEAKISRMSARRDAIEFLNHRGGYTEKDVYEVAERFFKWAETGKV